MDEKTYCEIRRRIKKYIQLNNGYQLDDLVQETAIKLIGIEKLSAIGQCVKVAKNILIDYHRKQQKFKCIYDKKAEPICYPECDNEIIIPEIHKSLYALRYVFGYKYREIKDVLGIPLGSVKCNIFKMKRDIKKANLL